VEINGTGDVTVSGSAEKDVNSVFVVIGPKPSGGYWVGYANVSNQQWQADVPTNPPWQNYTISAYYYGPSGSAAPMGRLVPDTTSQTALKFTFKETEPSTAPPPPPPAQIVTCAVQFGPSCFNGPGFGPPSVYQSNK
jgi:hypothetical protein